MDDTKEVGNDKRSWRERLGIGTKDMPKISGDFKSPTTVVKEPALMTSDSDSVKTAPKVQAVTRPAPMAPRAPARPLASAPPVVNVTPGPRVASPLPPLATSRPIYAPLPQSPTSQATAPPTQVGLTPDALANRLKAQREAAEKLAEQRIQIARQRAEAAARAEQSARAPAPPQAQSIAPPMAAPATSSGTKPKFTFAEDDSKIAGSSATVIQPAVPQPVMPRPSSNRPAGIVPQSPVTMAPPRQPLGAERVTGRPQVPPAFTPHPPPDLSYQPGYAPSQGYSPPQPNQFNPPYRPVDPVTGYGGPMPGSRPPVMPPRPQGAPYAPVAPAGYAHEDDEQGYVPVPPRPQRPAPLPPRQATNYADPDDIFEQPMRSPRRPTAGEYRQAYQEADMGYEEEQPRSNSRWLLFLIPLAAIAAAGFGIWFWQSNLRDAQVATPTPAVTTEPTPVETPLVVAPPEQVKADPEPAAAAVAPTQTPEVARPTKKQIYDRIVGDNEVPGNASLNPSEVQPADPSAVTPELQPATIDPAAPALQDQGTGESAPLPVPPPGDGTQGAIDAPPALPGEVATPAQVAEATSLTETTPDSTKASAPEITPAAATASKTATETEGLDESALAAASADATTDIRPSTAEPEAASQIEDILPMPKEKLAATEPPAVPAPAQPVQDTQPALASVADPPATPAAPKPSAAAAAFVDASTQADATDAEASVTVPVEGTATDDATAVTEVTDAKPVEAKPKKIAAKQKPAKKIAAKSTLGAEPVVLVAPGGQSTNANAALASSDGVYGELPAAQQNQAAQATPPKRRTLLELFNQQQGGTQSNQQVNQQATQPVEQPAEQQVASVDQPAQPRLLSRPKQQQVASREPEPATGGAYVAQLSSFRTQDEAQREFQRIKARHPQVLGGLSPVINETTVGGSKRYRLAVGTMQSNAAAGQVCSRLLSAGERDCLVRQR